ncbi:UNVERIFIED_CONTAM: hypothetical protein NCL1_43364 [Trichonephila clavipes]
MSVPICDPSRYANWLSAGWHFYYPKKTRYRMAVEVTQWSLAPQELQQARRVRIFYMDFNFLVPKTNIDATARTVTTKFTAIRIHMNSVFVGTLLILSRSNCFR